MKRLAAIVVGGAFAAGCAVGPNYRRPTVEPTKETRGQLGPVEAASMADQAWWEIFQDDVLKALIDEALRNGFDARLAVWRVEEARANAGIARSRFFPQVGYQAEWSRSRSSSFVIPNAEPVNLHDVNLGLSWEIDLWGRIRRSSEAALAQYLASREARRGVLLSLVAEVATQYFQLRELDAELEIAYRTRAAFQGTFDLFNARLQRGAASALETSSAEASLATVAARVPALERQIVAQENLICFLLGRNPEAIPRGASLNAQPFPPEIPAGLPSSLLERRPDLLETEQQLVAANAAVGVATANFFPTISLTGALGGISPQVSELLQTGKTWSMAAGLAGPLFQGLRLKNQYDVSVAQWEEAKLHYEAAVTSAFSEVSSAIVAQQKLAEQEVELARAVRANQEAVRLSNTRYLAGLSDYLQVLQAQQQLFPAENALAQTRFSRLSNFAQLYKALGGGWSVGDPAWIRPPSDSFAPKSPAPEH